MPWGHHAKFSAVGSLEIILFAKIHFYFILVYFIDSSKEMGTNYVFVPKNTFQNWFPAMFSVMC